jgi:hypothetical protein
MLHQPNRFFILIETDKEAADAIFYFLRETKKQYLLTQVRILSEIHYK